MFMNWLEPDPSYVPVVRSLADYVGPRLIFTFGGYWRYYPSYESDTEYQSALDVLAHGAYVALEAELRGSPIGVSKDPYGTCWINWLLPMSDWEPEQGNAPDWDNSVSSYAQLFESGTLDRHYAGGCISRDPLIALRLCADLVVRNHAPCSLVFCAIRGGASVYFHNTSSLGVCIPDNADYDPVPVVHQLESLGLTYQP